LVLAFGDDFLVLFALASIEVQVAAFVAAAVLGFGPVAAEEIYVESMPHVLLVEKPGAWIVVELLPYKPVVANVAEVEALDIGTRVAVVGAVEGAVVAFLEALKQRVDYRLMDLACMQTH